MMLNIKSVIIILSLSLLQLSGCSAVQKFIDRKGIESSCKEIMLGYVKPDPAGFSDFLKKFDLSVSTTPIKPVVQKTGNIGNWKLDFEGSENLIQEKIYFKTKLSSITYQDDRLVVYVYRKGDIKGKRVMIFVPGMGISDFALKFIYRFFRSIILQNYILALYVPPCHLERILPGGKTGEGFFTYNHERNIRIIAGCTAELRTLAKYFNDNGASEISGWGGSMGAAFLLLAARFEKFSSLTVMIPVIDWNTLLLDSPYLCELKDNMKNDGLSPEIVREGYNRVSPLYTPVKVTAGRMMILFGEYDQLTPVSTLEKFVKNENNPVLKFYPRSHSTILTDFSVYDDFDKQLKIWSR